VETAEEIAARDLRRKQGGLGSSADANVRLMPTDC